MNISAAADDMLSKEVVMPVGRQAQRARLAAILSVALVIAGCGSDRPSPSALTATSPPASAIASAATTAAPSARATMYPSVGESLPTCADPSWRCLTVDVPLDRSDPSRGTIPIHAYIQSRTSQTTSPMEPVIVTPGGPGASMWADHGWLPMADWWDHHDTVLIDPRGVGESGTIDCPMLQAGPTGAAGLTAAVKECAGLLGAAADRYGTVDAALDVEAVRAALDIDAFDYYGASYATVTQQAYAARFPERIHAMVVDSGFPLVDTLKGYYWGADYPTAWLRVLDLLCERDVDCAPKHPNPRAEIEGLLKTVRARPLTGTAPNGNKVTVAEAQVVAMLLAIGRQPWQLKASDLLDAVSAAAKGDTDGLLGVADAYPIWPQGGGSPTGFSNGLNAAASCIDSPAPWDPADGAAVRRQKFAAAVKALPADTFAPFEMRAYVEAITPFFGMCPDWPAPTRTEPLVPDGFTFDQAPVLILSGDLDTSAPTEVNRRLTTVYPKGIFALIANASHDAAAPFSGTCAGPMVGRFFDTLQADANACATYQE